MNSVYQEHFVDTPEFPSHSGRCPIERRDHSATNFGVGGSWRINKSKFFRPQAFDISQCRLKKVWNFLGESLEIQLPSDVDSACNFASRRSDAQRLTRSSLELRGALRRPRAHRRGDGRRPGRRQVRSAGRTSLMPCWAAQDFSAPNAI
jgi:hypothetical protein